MTQASAQKPRNDSTVAEPDIWDQHAAILKAIAKGDGERAEALVRTHLTQASGFMVNCLRG